MLQFAEVVAFYQLH